MLGGDGISDFDGLHSRKNNDEVQFYAFDMLVSEAPTSESCPFKPLLKEAERRWKEARSALLSLDRKEPTSKARR
ncbi:hypothetical protein [Bradyrhizobium sp. JYMT SZCCT0428]|uniref:hypothetical protein n=1 Tax=Bradyrhizobium sp. JYMT SZCCT0428 TaxID=2807673 RepID=UPI001BA8371D|nr:hypothetical protein [Bradyrhizobium sp. JYMT SZCCT0428]MBR1156202.1 hypothetical protein [Bradyrhizobium sp. JYMT SZCCT0428]